MDDALTLEVRGVGYLVGATTKATKYTVDEELTLHTHLAVRETALNLYGFTTITELELFELLLLVPKVGPKSALQIMNQASPTLLVESIGKNDPQQLHKLSGIGKKTCENVVQYLQNKIEGFGFAIAEETTRLPDQKMDAIDALVSLGYDLSSARDVIGDLEDTLNTNELVTRALKQM